jgi:uncharacterized iron-regulated membrane protein
MRWLMIALLVSLTALLIAAAGLARFIWRQRRRSRAKPSAPAQGDGLPVPGQVEETDAETEI